jgi:hypothetical protein
MTADTVQALRRLRARALADPDVVAFEWWRLRDVHGQVLERCPCGQPYDGVRREHRIGEPYECRCGLVHLAHKCKVGCGRVTLDPPPTDGCGSLQEQAEASRSRAGPATGGRASRPGC